mgnify:CR=1 FL=1
MCRWRALCAIAIAPLCDAIARKKCPEMSARITIADDAWTRRRCAERCLRRLCRVRSATIGMAHSRRLPQTCHLAHTLAAVLVSAARTEYAQTLFETF